MLRGAHAQWLGFAPVRWALTPAACLIFATRFAARVGFHASQPPTLVISIEA